MSCVFKLEGRRIEGTDVPPGPDHMRKYRSLVDSSNEALMRVRHSAGDLVARLLHVVPK